MCFSFALRHAKAAADMLELGQVINMEFWEIEKIIEKHDSIVIYRHINPDYDADQLAAAVALHEGFTYQPDSGSFWKQSIGNEKSWLFVTTRHMTAAFLDSIHNSMEDGEYLLIACRSFDKGLEKVYPEISIKKIPQMLLDRCEFGKTDYNLNIVHPPVYEDEEEPCDE